MALHHATKSVVLVRLTAALCLLLATPSHAQIQQAWVAKYNNGITNGTRQALKMALDSSGDIYVTGFSQNANSNIDYATLKYAPNGVQLWAARYDSTNVTSASPAALAVDTSGNVVVTGNATTVKYDSNGNQLWTAPYPGSCIGTDSNGNVFVVGYSTGFDTVKLAPSGTNLWTQNYTSPWGPSLSQCLTVDSAGNVYVTGSDQPAACTTEGSLSNCPVYGLTIKYNPNGAQVWGTIYDPPGLKVPSSVAVRGTALDPYGALYVLADYSPTNDGTTTPYGLVRLAPDGTGLWATGNPTDDIYSRARGIAVISSGNARITGQNYYGYPSSSYGTFSVSNSGVYTWSNNYPDPPSGVSAGLAIAADPFGNCYVTGYSPGATTSNDIVTIKYNENGNQVWLQRYGGPAHGNDAGNAIAVDNSGNVYVAGYESVVGGGTEMVLIKYSPFTLQPQTNGTVLLQLQGAPGETFAFQASTNLQTWTNIGTATAATNGAVQFLDTNAPLFPCRFYITTPQ